VEPLEVGPIETLRSAGRYYVRAMMCVRPEDAVGVGAGIGYTAWEILYGEHRGQFVVTLTPDDWRARIGRGTWRGPPTWLDVPAGAAL
jgi:hypothetical protein